MQIRVSLMEGEIPQKKGKVGKISNWLTVVALVSIFCLGPLIETPGVYDSSLIQRLDALGGCDLKDRLLGYFTPTPKYILSTGGTFLNVVHSATIPACDYPLSWPSLARLIESAYGRSPAKISIDSALKVRAPPLFLSDKSTL